MKKSIWEFLVLFANIIAIFAFMLSSYIVFINMFHYRETHYVYKMDVSSYGDFTTFKNSIDSLLKKLEPINGNTNNVDVVKSSIVSCIDAIKKGKLYNYTGVIGITAMDIYDLNLDIPNSINNECLFSTINRVKDAIKNTPYANSFNSVYGYVDNQKEIVLSTSNYLSNRVLNNSEYSYSTENSKISFFNEMSNDFNLTVKNYINLVNTTERVVDWFINIYGGVL